MPRQLLLIDSDPDASRILTRQLGEAGYAVRHAGGGIRGLTLVREFHPDLVLLDLHLPDLDAGEVIARLKRSGQVPVIVLSSPPAADRSPQANRTGADDYLSKPVDLGALLALIAQRLVPERGDDIRVGPLALRCADRTCFYRDVRLRLTAKEFDLIAMLARHPGRVFAREELSRGLWHGPTPAGNVLDVHMANLRSKLREEGAYGLLRTIRGVGYTLRADG